ncbi:glycosyltransferase [bacterium]|nr:glycosyltransferase [bacterium]
MAETDQAQGEILYVQFTNPGSYPPLEHSSDVFLDRGFKTTFMGIESRGASRALRFAEREGREVHLLPWVDPGLQQKSLYLKFLVGVVWRALVDRPYLVYCSDHWSAPAGMVLACLGFRVIYHEHDAPAHSGTLFQSTILRLRRALLRRVLVVVPSEGRGELVREDGASHVVVVRNVPSKHEVVIRDAQVNRTSNEPLRLIYQGSFGLNRTPATLVKAMLTDELRGRVTLSLIGYETVGDGRCIEVLKQTARELGSAELVQDLGPMSRHEMLSRGALFDVGLSLMPMAESDVNYASMAGASNKPFDYMAQGLPMICSDLPQWRVLLGRHAVYCDPRSVESIVAVLRDLLRDRKTLLEQGIRAQEMILNELNYELEFSRVLSAIQLETAG